MSSQSLVKKKIPPSLGYSLLLKLREQDFPNPNFLLSLLLPQLPSLVLTFAPSTFLPFPSLSLPRFLCQIRYI